MLFPNSHTQKANYFKFDQVGQVMYLGEARYAASDTDPVWKITRIDVTSGVVITFADENENYDNVWADRTTLTYG